MTTVVDINDHRKQRFGEFAEAPGILDGEKIQIERVLNQEIEVIGYSLRPSKYGKNVSGMCLTLQFILSEQRRVLFTGSDVLIGQLQKYGDRIPFLATIRKVDKYYTLS
jgi:hypothetical protein